MADELSSDQANRPASNPTRRRAITYLGAAGITALAGCSGDGSGGGGTTGGTTSGSGPESITHLAWGGDTQDVITSIGEEWSEESGIDFESQSAGGNSEFISILKRNPEAIDLWTSNDFSLALARQADEQLVVRPHDYSKVPNYEKAFPEEWRNLAFLAEDQPGFLMRLVILGMAYNTNQIDADLTSWADLQREALNGKLTMQDNATDRFIQAALMMGEDLTDVVTDDALFEEAQSIISDFHPYVFNYYSSLSESTRLLREGTAHAAEAFSGRIVILQNQGNEHIKFVVPDEGVKAPVDTLSIIEASEKKEAVYDFLNYFYRRENLIRFAEGQGYPVPVSDPPESITSLPGYVESPDEIYTVDQQAIADQRTKMQQAFSKIKQQ